MTQPITGYRQLSAEEVAQINALKALAESVGAAVNTVLAIPGVDLRWASEGRTDLQKGFMSLIRAIAQPSTF